MRSLFAECRKTLVGAPIVLDRTGYILPQWQILRKGCTAAMRIGEHPSGSRGEPIYDSIVSIGAIGACQICTGRVQVRAAGNHIVWLARRCAVTSGDYNTGVSLFFALGHGG